MNELSSAKPIPGGGSAAALVGAIGISLSLMVANITLKKVGNRGQKKLKIYIKKLKQFKKQISHLIDKDPKVYKRVINSYNLSRENPQRMVRIENALVASYNVMKQLCVDLCTVHDINSDIFSISRGAILNDVCVSEAFIKAALSSAISTASLNAEYVKNKRIKKRLLDELQRIDNKRKKRRLK